MYADKRQTVGSTYTIETWFKTNTTRGGKLLGFGNNQARGSNQYDKHIYMTNDGKLVYGVYTGATRTVTTSGAYNDNQWHHVVASQGPGGMTLYVDGVQKGTLNVTTHENFSGYWHAAWRQPRRLARPPDERVLGGNCGSTRPPSTRPS